MAPRRTCLLCRKYVDAKLLLSTHPRRQNAVVLMSSLVLFNAIDLEDAKRCYNGASCRKFFCDQHYVDAAKFMASELACLGIRFASYIDQPRGELVTYVNEKDIPLHLADSIQGTAKKLDETLVITRRRICDFLNYCLYRYELNNLNSTLSSTESQQEEAGSSSTKVENSSEDVKPSGLLCGTSSNLEMTVVGREHCAEDVSADAAVEQIEETDPALLNSVFPVKGDRLLSLFRFCPKCGTQISSKRRSIVLAKTGPSPIVQYICSTCTGKHCWYFT